MKAGPCSWTATGMPLAAPRPTGTEMPPLPTMLLEMVYMSEAYMAVGSEISPKRKAVLGLDGSMITSQLW